MECSCQCSLDGGIGSYVQGEFEDIWRVGEGGERGGVAGCGDDAGGGVFEEVRAEGVANAGGAACDEPDGVWGEGVGCHWDWWMRLIWLDVEGYC